MYAHFCCYCFKKKQRKYKPETNDNDYLWGQEIGSGMGKQRRDWGFSKHNFNIIWIFKLCILHIEKLKLIKLKRGGNSTTLNGMQKHINLSVYQINNTIVLWETVLFWITFEYYIYTFNGSILSVQLCSEDKKSLTALWL